MCQVSSVNKHFSCGSFFRLYTTSKLRFWTFELSQADLRRTPSSEGAIKAFTLAFSSYVMTLQNALLSPHKIADVCFLAFEILEVE